MIVALKSGFNNQGNNASGPRTDPPPGDQFNAEDCPQGFTTYIHYMHY